MNADKQVGGGRPRGRSWRMVSLGAVLAGIGLMWALWWDSPPRYNDPVEPNARGNTNQGGDTPVAFGMWPAITNQDDKAIMMAAFSGGGSRAAAVAWKTLETLQSIPYVFEDARGAWVESNLAREIDLVAGISGGSFAAAGWCLSGEDLAPFRKRFVERNIQGALARGLISVGGLKAAFSRRYSRIDLAAELYDREVFDGMTFGKLPSRPILLIHATDLALGQRFTFAAESFGLIGSSLASYPVGYACAASSAFPILLNPMTLKNYGPTADFWNSASISNRYVAARENQRNNLEAYFRRVQWDHYRNAATNRYIHLADGGLVDNQGLQSLLDQFKDGILSRRLNQTPALERLVLLNVNAGVASESRMDRSPSPPGVAGVVEGAMVTSMDLLSAKRWAEVQAESDQLYKSLSDLRSVGGAADAPSLLALEKPYLIEVNFRNIRDPELQREAFSLPTSFKLNAGQLALIDTVVPRLIYEDPALQRLLMVQLAGLILKAQPAGRRAELQRDFLQRGLDLGAVGEPELAAVRKDPNGQRMASGLLRVLLQGLPTLNRNGFDLERLKTIAAGLKGPGP